MDMDAMVTDSHQLMMSEEQRHHLFKVRHTYSGGKASSFPLLCTDFRVHGQLLVASGVSEDSYIPEVYLTVKKVVFRSKLTGNPNLRL